MQHLQILTTIYWLDWCKIAATFASCALFFLLLYRFTQTTSRYKSFPLLTLLLPVCAVSGILLTYVPFPYAYICIALVLVTLLAQRRSLPLSTVLLACFAMSTGLLFSIHTIRHSLMHKIIQVYPLTMHGHIVDIAQWSKSKYGKIITIHVQRVNHFPLSCFLRFYLYAPYRHAIGDYIALYNLQDKSDGQTSNNSYLHNLARDGIIATFFMKKLPGKTLIRKDPRYKFARYLHAQRNRIYHSFEKKLSPDVFTFLSALFFGNKKTSDYARIKKHFAHWGVTHYLARSGLHIVILIMLWTFLLSLFPLHFLIKNIILLFFLILYATLSWTSISFYRALWLCTMYIIGQLRLTQVHALHIFSIITTATLIYNPYHLSFLDFQLSFFLTFTLLALSSWKRRRFALVTCDSNSK